MPSDGGIRIILDRRDVSGSGLAHIRSRAFCPVANPERHGETADRHGWLAGIPDLW